MSRFCLSAIVFLAATFLSVAGTALATNIVPPNFSEYGTTVNGFQDFFTEASLNNGNWTEIASGAGVTPGSSGNFTLSGGYLNMSAVTGGDPNKLLYSGATYDANNQNVLAMIQVTGGSDTDGFRGGVGAESDPSNGAGINLLFRQSGNGGDTSPTSNNHFNFLNDGQAWGPLVGGANAWNASTFYWVREVSNGTTVTGEVWPADGTTPESSAITGSWSVSGRSGLAGLVSNSTDGNGTFQVNYVLIQSTGLPPIVAGIPVPEPGSLVLAGLGGAFLCGAALRRRVKRA